MVSSDTSLRRANEMGSWELELTEELGMDHSKQLDALQSYLLSEESNISDNISDSSNQGDSVGGNIADDDDSDVVQSSILFPPFGVPGIRANERRTYEGQRHIWLSNASKWTKITTD